MLLQTITAQTFRENVFNNDRKSCRKFTDNKVYKITDKHNLTKLITYKNSCTFHNLLKTLGQWLDFTKTTQKY